MAWTAPATAVAGGVVLAADFNTYVRDNQNEMAPAKATTPGSIFAVTGTNMIAERTPSALIDTGTATFTSTTFADPATGTPGPSVTVTTGPTAIVAYRAQLSVPSTTARVVMSYEISGATTRAASETRSLGYSVSGSASGLTLRGWVIDLATLLTSGSNTFKLVYNVSSSTGTAVNRRIWVLPL